MSGPLSTFNARVEWLVANQPVWSSWPSGSIDNIIIQKMQQAGLMSGKTSAKYVDLTKLITAARKKIREQKSK